MPEAISFDSSPRVVSRGDKSKNPWKGQDARYLVPRFLRAFANTSCSYPLKESRVFRDWRRQVLGDGVSPSPLNFFAPSLVASHSNVLDEIADEIFSIFRSLTPRIFPNCLFFRSFGFLFPNFLIQFWIVDNLSNYSFYNGKEFYIYVLYIYI